MTELQEITQNKKLPDLFKELKHQLKKGESLGGTICSHIVDIIESKGGKIITQKQYKNIHSDYKGVWGVYSEPQWKGKRTAMLGECRLSIEDQHFIIL